MGGEGKLEGDTEGRKKGEKEGRKEGKEKRINKKKEGKRDEERKDEQVRPHSELAKVWGRNALPEWVQAVLLQESPQHL